MKPKITAEDRLKALSTKIETARKAKITQDAIKKAQAELRALKTKKGK